MKAEVEKEHTRFQVGKAFQDGALPTSHCFDGEGGWGAFLIFLLWTSLRNPGLMSTSCLMAISRCLESESRGRVRSSVFDGHGVKLSSCLCGFPRAAISQCDPQMFLGKKRGKKKKECSFGRIPSGINVAKMHPELPLPLEADLGQQQRGSGAIRR